MRILVRALLVVCVVEAWLTVASVAQDYPLLWRILPYVGWGAALAFCALLLYAVLFVDHWD